MESDFRIRGKRSFDVPHDIGKTTRMRDLTSEGRGRLQFLNQNHPARKCSTLKKPPHSNPSSDKAGARGSPNPISHADFDLAEQVNLCPTATDSSRFELPTSPILRPGTVLTVAFWLLAAIAAVCPMNRRRFCRSEKLSRHAYWTTRMTTSELPAVSNPSPSLRWGRMGILIGLALAAGTGFASFLEWSVEQSHPAFLSSKKTIVTANCAARIRDTSAKPGQSVVPGDPLFQLVDVQLEDRLIAKRREIAELEAEIRRAKITAEIDLAWRRRELQAEVFETQLKEAALSQEKLNKQVEQLAWKEHLTSADSNVSPMVAEVDHPFRSITKGLHLPDDRRLQAMLREDAAAATAETLTTQIALCEQRLKTIAVLEKDLETKIRAASGVDVNDARLAGAKLELAALESQSKELIITSPTYGTVGDLRFQSGDRVPSGATLLEILDDVPPHVVAQLPSAAASRVRHGTKVSLIFPSNEHRIGIITDIPPQITTAPGSSDSYVAVKIEPAGKLWPKFAIGSSIKVLLP